MKYLDLLGHECRDVVTGFTGVAESISYDLYGCIQVVLKPPIHKDAKPGEIPEGRWFDAKRLKQISTAPIMEVPDFSQPEIGPAEKPQRLTERVA